MSVVALAELTSKNEDTIENLEQKVKELKQERKELKEVCRIAQYFGDEDDILTTFYDEIKQVENGIKKLDSESERQLKSEVAELQGRRDSFLEVYFPRHSQLSEEYHKLKSTEADLKDAIAKEQSKSLDNILEENPKVLSLVNILNEKMEDYLIAKTKYNSEMHAITEGSDYNQSIIELMLVTDQEVGIDANHIKAALTRLGDDELLKEDLSLEFKLAIKQIADKLDKKTYTQLMASYEDMKEKENIPTSVFGYKMDSIGKFLTEYRKE